MKAASNDPAIRTYEPDDLESVIRLWQDCDLTRPWNDPRKDIDLCQSQSGNAILFVAEAEGRIVGTIMCGQDGHRGWHYYLAVTPSRQRQGIGRRLARHAEGWIKRSNIPKSQTMVRTGNAAAEEFYSALGYDRGEVSLFERFLDPTAAVQKDRHSADGPASKSEQEIITTYLEMRERPTRPAVSIPARTALLKADPPGISFYRYLYETVGAPWHWYERNQISDEELLDIIHHPKVDIYVLYSDGSPAGFAELDMRQPGETELAYFGLIPGYIGKGLGLYLMTWIVDEAWRNDPKRLWVHTCNLDHPRALNMYQRCGFSPYKQEQSAVPVVIPFRTN